MKLQLGKSHNGQGIFATSDFEPDEPILEFRGPRIAAKNMPQPYDSVADHYIQIDPELYLGPSGGLDDFVNHSCDPNSGLKFEGDTIVLVSIRRIETGEEVALDYSTTRDEDDWELECRCGSSQCRGRIQDFRKLPAALQEKYIQLRIVPDYLRSVRDL